VVRVRLASPSSFGGRFWLTVPLAQRILLTAR
jgi:hypothetical protein